VENRPNRLKPAPGPRFTGHNSLLVVDRHRGLVGDGALDVVVGNDHGARQRES